MPLSNLWRNCFYYWSFGAVIGYPLCQPGQYFPAAGSTQVQVGLGIFAVSELCNLICHVSVALTNSLTHSRTYLLILFIIAGNA